MNAAKPLPQMSAAEYRRPTNESDLQRQIVKTAKQFGWYVFHPPIAQGVDRGYPDLTLIHEQYFSLWIECKGPNAKIRPEQVTLLARINAGDRADRLGIMAFPADLDAVGQLLAGQPVDCYDDPRGFKRVRLIEEVQ